jgi:uncharacterized protein
MAATPTRDNTMFVAFREFVLKIHGRCDLACDYCYVYTMADQRWRDRPKAMSRQTMLRTAARICEHARTHGLSAVDVVLHGGEPLLAGHDGIEFCVRALLAEAGDDVRVHIRLHTNGVRLDSRFLRLFHTLGVRVSVSLDGEPSAHDRHRRRPDGTGSHSQVSESIRRLSGAPYRELFSGLLCTIDLCNDPLRTYQAMLEFDPPMLDFLLPHGNWSAPPPDRVPGSEETPYADWLIVIFEHWYGAPRRATRIRMFEEILALLMGGHSMLEGVGLAPSLFAVVETDGAIEQSDMLSSTYSGAAITGLNVEHDAFDAALDLPGFRAVRAGVHSLAPACRACALRRVCGGGLYPHRYRRQNGFDNPSVYCPDLYRLIDYIRCRVSADLAAIRRTAP